MAPIESFTSFTTSRRGLFKIAGAAGMGLALAQAGTLGALAASNESIQDIINIAATAEALAVTLSGAVLAGASKYDGGKGLSPFLVTVIKAVQAEEQDHYNYLASAGAKPLTLTFTVPQNLVSITNDSKALLTFIQQAETVFIGAYTAAAQEFANLGHPELSQVAYQIGGVECEHRALVNYGLGISPPNNLGFEMAPYHNVAEAAAVIQGLGLLGTSNPAATLKFTDFNGSVDHTGLKNESLA